MPEDTINSIQSEPKGEASENAEAAAETSAENTGEEYPVIHETVKKRPVKYRKILQKGLALTGGAVLFGIVAAFVFSRFVPVFQADSAEPVQFEQDSVPAATSPGDVTGTVTQAAEETQIPDATETAEPSESAESTPADSTSESGAPVEETPSGTPASEETAEGKEDSSKVDDVAPNELPKPTPSPAVDPAVASAERLRQNRLLYSDLRMLSMATARSVVTVTGITTTEDWFNTTSEERRQTTGVIVADNGVS